VRPAARVQVKGTAPLIAGHLHQADGPLHLRGAAQGERRHVLRTHEVRPHGPVLPDDPVDPILHLLQRLAREARGVQVYGADLRAQVEGDGIRVQQLLAGRGEQMLTGVLLHVVKAAGPVYLAGHLVVGEGGRQDVHDGPVRLPHLGAQDRDAAQMAPVGGLTAGGRVEGRAVQNHRRMAIPGQPLHHPGGETGQVGIGIVQAMGHGE
jgi:hypothetical protein